MAFCVQDEGNFVGADNAQREASLDKIKALGATCIRQMLYMHHLHPCGGGQVMEYLRRYVHLIDAANARGLKVQLVITGVAAGWGAPRDASGKACAKPVGMNPKPKDLVQFIEKYVPLFAAKKVTRWSIWNEPNLGSFLCEGTFSDNTDIDKARCKGSTFEKQAKSYRALYLAAWDKIKALKKAKRIPQSTEVLIGEFAGAHDGLKFLSLVAKGKRTLKTCGIATHPYQYCFAPEKKKFNFPNPQCKNKQVGGMGWTGDFTRLAAKLAKEKRLITPGGKAAPIFLTEFGYHRTGANQMPEEYRAKWYPRALSFAKKKGARQMTLYQVYPSAPGRWDTSLLNPDASPSPSYIAVQNWAKTHGYIKK